MRTHSPLVNWNTATTKVNRVARRYAGADTNQRSKRDKWHESQLSWQPKETWVAKSNNYTQYHPCPLFAWLCNTRLIIPHRTYHSLYWSCKHRSYSAQEWHIHKIGMKEYTKNELGQAVQNRTLYAKQNLICNLVHEQLNCTGSDCVWIRLDMSSRMWWSAQHSLLHNHNPYWGRVSGIQSMKESQPIWEAWCRFLLLLQLPQYCSALFVIRLPP